MARAKPTISQELAMYHLQRRGVLGMGGRLICSMHASVKRGWVEFNGAEYVVTAAGIAALTAKTGLVWSAQDREWSPPPKAAIKNV